MKRCKGLVCFIVMFLLISIVGISVYASDDNLHESCVEEHFGYIQELSYSDDDSDDDSDIYLYPSNPIGSCPYVAMSLLLSYYDAYWRDGFVPNDYETPGIINQQSGRIWQEFHFSLENDDWWTFANNQNLDLNSEDE